MIYCIFLLNEASFFNFLFKIFIWMMGQKWNFSSIAHTASQLLALCSLDTVEEPPVSHGLRPHVHPPLLDGEALDSGRPLSLPMPLSLVVWS